MNNPDELVLKKHKLTHLSDLLCSNDNNNLNECDDNNERESGGVPAACQKSQPTVTSAFANLSPIVSAALSPTSPLSRKRKAMQTGPSPAPAIPKTETTTETSSGIETSSSVPASCGFVNNNNNSSSNSNSGGGSGGSSGGGCGGSGSSRKVFECDVCNMIFSNGANMRRHRMRHTGVKPYECRICQKRFFRKDHLAEHFTTHTKSLPFHCPICDRGFQRQIAMRAHFQNEHVGQHDLVKSCPLCSYHASSMKGLRVHFFNRHGVDLDNPGPHSSLLMPAATSLATLSLNTGSNLKRSSVSLIAESKGLVDSLTNDNSNTSTISNPNSVNMSSFSNTSNYQLSVFNGNNSNNNNDDDDDEEAEINDGEGDGDADGDCDGFEGEGEGTCEEEADGYGEGDGNDVDDDDNIDRNLISSKIVSNRRVADSISITLSKATVLNELQNHSDSGDSSYGINANNKETVGKNGFRMKCENKERRSRENATPPMHFLTPQVEISMASDDTEMQNAANQYNDLNCYQDNDQDHEHDSGNMNDKKKANSNDYPKRHQKNQSNEMRIGSKIAPSPSPSLFLQQIIADQINPLFHDHSIAATSTSSSASGNNNLNNATIIPSISLIPIKQETIGCTEDNPNIEQVFTKTSVSNCLSNVMVQHTVATKTATASATACPVPSSYCGDTAKKRSSLAVLTTTVASHPATVTTSAASTAISAAATVPLTTPVSSTDAVSISPLFSFIHTTSNNSGSGGSVGVRDASQNSSLSSLMKVSPLKSLLKDELKRKPAYSVNTTSRTVNMYSGGGAIGQSNNQTMIVWPNFSKTKVPENTAQPHNVQQAITEMKCLYCGIFFPDQTLYFLHIGCHSESNPWKCNICGEQCSNIYEFNSHLLSKSH